MHVHWVGGAIQPSHPLSPSSPPSPPGGSDGNESACNAGDPGLIPAEGRSLEKGMATHPSILAWRISWTEDPGRLQSMRSQRVEPDWATKNIYIYFFFFSRLFSGKQYYERLSIVPCTIQEVLVAYLLYTVSWLLALKRYHLDTNPSSFTMWSRTYYLTSLCSISSFRK